MLVTVNVMMNMTANKTTIVGAGALSIKKDSRIKVILRLTKKRETRSLLFQVKIRKMHNQLKNIKPK